MQGIQKLITLILLMSALLVACADSTDFEISDNEILVRVNDDFIYRERVDLVYLDYEGTYERIVMDTILELLVVQQAPNFGISLSEEEVQDILDLFEEVEPDYFIEAVETFGIEELREKLRIRNLFTMTKNYVIDNILFVDGYISSETITWFTEENGLTEQFANFTEAEILEGLRREIIEFTFRRWMEDLRDEADIEFIGFIPSS
jgi:hypothetical protein